MPKGQGTLIGRVLLCLVLCVWGGALAAQSPVDGWAETARAAERLLARENAPEAALTDMRRTLAESRSAALAEQDRFQARLETLSAELRALGAPPAEGETEADDIVRQRVALGKEISEVRAPVTAAEAAYQRADGLINEIDGVLRARLSRELTRQGPLPVLPATWAAAGKEFSWFWTRFGVEAANRPQLAPRALAVSLVQAVAGLLLITLVRRRVVLGLSHAMSDSSSPATRAAIGFSINIARFALPLLGALLILRAIRPMIPNGPILNALSDVASSAVIALVVAYWLGRAIFTSLPNAPAVLTLPPDAAQRGAGGVLFLGALLALHILANAIINVPALGEAGAVMIMAPILLLGAYGIYRLAGVIAHEAVPDEADSAQVLRLLRLVLTLIAIAIPVATLLGYRSFATFLFQPTLLSLALLGAVMVLFSVFRDSLDRWLDGAGDQTRRTARSRFRLLPVLIGFTLFSLSIPVLAVIWGARVTDLEEVWIWLRDGVAIGESRVSVTDFLTLVLIFVVGYTLTRMLQAVVRSSVLPRTDIDVGGKNAILTGLGYVGITLSALLAISASGLNLSNLAIVAGALSVGIGFGLQTIVSNFVSGIILLIERPIKEGDWIEVAGHAGYVRRISVRATEIETFDRSSVIVPNAELIAGSVLNRTHNNLTGRIVVPVGVAYGSDVGEVERILKSIAKSHPLVQMVPEPSVIFRQFGASSLDFEIRAFLRDVNNSLSVTSEMNHQILQRFEAAGIEIPFAHRDITIRNADALAPLGSPRAEDA